MVESASPTFGYLNPWQFLAASLERGLTALNQIFLGVMFEDIICKGTVAMTDDRFRIFLLWCLRRLLSSIALRRRKASQFIAGSVTNSRSSLP